MQRGCSLSSSAAGPSPGPVGQTLGPGTLRPQYTAQPRDRAPKTPGIPLAAATARAGRLARDGADGLAVAHCRDSERNFGPGMWRADSAARSSSSSCHAAAAAAATAATSMFSNVRLGGAGVGGVGSERGRRVAAPLPCSAPRN